MPNKGTVISTTPKPPDKSELIACDICLREVPRSEAVVPEASDYVAHFCGLHCYELWKNLPDKREAPPKKPAI